MLDGILVSHTHWDRAWYLPFQTYRVRLVRLIDGLLDLLEGDMRYRAFTLDGQTVLLDDYLAIRPEHADRLRALVQAGRLRLGPWYTLPDLFLASGEALIRNLQRGLADAETYGETASIGYCPDPFGHPAQMPQILRGVGLSDYVFMRGLSHETKAACGGLFDWVAPDGSAVRALYQPLGYFPAGALGHPEVFGRFEGHKPTADHATERLREAADALVPMHPERTLLLSNGFDHMPPQPDLPDVLEALGYSVETPRGTLRLRHGSLGDVMRGLDAELDASGRTLARFSGDLIGNADHPILLSVYSARLYLKQANHAAEHLLRGIAEPLRAWGVLAGIGEDARPLLRQAWSLLMRCHPHDDICGCSVDPVHDDDEVRFRQVGEIADALIVEHLEALAMQGFDSRHIPTQEDTLATDLFVLNPHPWPQEVEVEADVLMPNPEGEFAEATPARALRAFDADGEPLALDVLATEAQVVRSAYLETTWGRRYRVRLRIDLPPLGYHIVRLEETDAPLDLAPAHADTAVRARLSQEADALGFEYQLDAGDTYSFGPVPDHGPWYAEEIARGWPEPNTLRLTHRLAVPAAYDRSTESPIGETILTLTTTLRARPDGSTAAHVAYDNTARDGRLRLIVPLGFATDRLTVDGHFRLAERVQEPVRTPEDAPDRHAGYPGELDYATHHQGDFALTSGPEKSITWIANRGLPEVELVHPGEALAAVAVTLCRSVGWLSVGGGRIRRVQAGPQVPTPGAQCLRPLTADLAIGRGWSDALEATQAARSFARAPYVREMPYLKYAPTNGPTARRDALLPDALPADLVLSALKPAEDGDGVILRVWNQTDSPTAALVRLNPSLGGLEATPTDLREQQTPSQHDDAQLPAGGIATYRIVPKNA